jgi:hypothetical protein
MNHVSGYMANLGSSNLMEIEFRDEICASYIYHVGAVEKELYMIE